MIVDGRWGKDRMDWSIHGHAHHPHEVGADNIWIGMRVKHRPICIFSSQIFDACIKVVPLGSGQRHQDCRLDCLLHLCKGLIAGAPVAGLVCFARPRQCGDCHLHWGPPLAKCLLSCRDRAQCWLVVEKAYHVQIAAIADENLLDALRVGIPSSGDGEVLRAKRASLLRRGERNSWIEIVLDEGKNRQIRRMLEHLQMEVLRLIRVRIGPLTLGDLAKGETRVIRKEEKQALDRAMKAASRTPAPSR